IAALFFLFFGVSTVVSRAQVKLRTAELQEQNKKLRLEIAERKQAEIALRKSEQKYRSLFDGVPVGLYRSTPGGQVLDANLAMAKMMGYPNPKALLTADATQIYVEPQVRLEWQKLLTEKGVVYNFETQWRRRDASIIWVRDSAQLVRDKQGEILYYDGKVEDITAQKRAEEEAVRRNQELSLRTAAIEQSAEGIIITDKNGQPIYANPAFERINGYSYSEIMGGLKLSQILTSSKHDPTYQALLKTIESGRTWHGRLTNKRKDGSLFTYDATVTPVRNAAGEVTHYAGVQRDVTKLLELEEQYRQAQKMEAIGRLTSGIAHDFNNLLTAINGYADLLKYDLPPHGSAQTMLDNILGAGQRAANLVRQLLIFSRKQVLNPTVLNLNTVVTDTNKMLQRIIGEHIVMTVNLAPGLRSVKADATQMEQVLMNLAVNARDAMPDGGELIIETANVVLDDERAGQMIDLDPGNYVTLTVSDTGAGISKEVKAHLFEPFFTTKEVGKGTGLGLATVFGIIKQSGGQIAVDSVLGQGSAFTIYLPAEGFVEPHPSQKEMIETAPTGVETLLVVEDDSVIREMIVGILRQYGYTVLEAADGLQALQSLEAHCAKVDLLLTDVVMPQMDGKTLADQVRQNCPQIKIIFTSGYPGDTIARRGVLDSGLTFMQKPFSPTALLKKIRQLLDEPS
ncbi:MAG TPA: PAS domain S-box protein, partial [Anaerolineae bacterium]|nr:PAS domain S-box protein [Anaerolineae bacterium]